MKYLAYKDYKYRQQFAKQETLKIIIKTLLANDLIDISTKFVLAYKLNKINKKSSISKIRNRCVYTFRGRSTNQKFSLSRIQMRELFSLGIVPGFKKAVW